MDKQIPPNIPLNCAIAKTILYNREQAANKDLPDSIRQEYADMVKYGEDALIHEADKLINFHSIGAFL